MRPGNRRFLEAVLWIVRTGAPRRDLNLTFKNWNSACGASAIPGVLTPAGPEWIGFLQCSMRVGACDPCVDRMERSQIGHESPEFHTGGAERRQFRRVFQLFQNVLVKSERCASCILL
jgi:hypothetical protein